jgi:hypothetical protein
MSEKTFAIYPLNGIVIGLLIAIQLRVAFVKLRIEYLQKEP